MIGCMVGETAILSAAQVKLLNLVDNVAFVEGCFGWLLLRDDVGKRVQFGFGGRVPKVASLCLGARVDRDRLATLVPRPDAAVAVAAFVPLLHELRAFPRSLHACSLATSCSGSARYVPWLNRPAGSRRRPLSAGP